MDLDWGERKKGVLYSDLFKSQGEKEEDKKKKNTTVISSKVESWSSISSSSSHSSSSGFSTPFYSDLSDNNNDDFIAELTRQMAERMLQDEEDDNDDEDEEEGNQQHNTFKNGLNSASVCVDDRVPPIQVYDLKNQPPVSKKGEIIRARRVKGTESAQRKQLEKTEQHYMQYRGRGRNGQSGSGMQAVFLCGSKTGSQGTGVFLPRVPTDPSDLKKKSGCSIVLMPTRVLQALELHFNKRNNSTLNTGGPLIHSCPKDESTKSELEIKGPGNSEEMQLPQEWTY